MTTNSERIKNGKKLTAPQKSALEYVKEGVDELMQCDVLDSEQLEDLMKTVYERGRIVQALFEEQYKRAVTAHKAGGYTPEEVYLTSYNDQIIEVFTSLFDLAEAKTISAVYWSAQELSENVYFVINIWSEKEDSEGS